MLCISPESARSAPAETARRAPEAIALTESGGLTLALQLQRSRSQSRGDVIYVHGGTFGADLSVFFQFNGISWADDLSAAGYDVWGFDFAGYGESERYGTDVQGVPGRIEDATLQLRRVVAAVRMRNGGRRVALLAHSRGGAVAARYAGEYRHDVIALLLFAPIVARTSGATAARPPLPSHIPLTVWAQYRRFVEDVPRGQQQVLDEAHMQSWAAAFLDSDSSAASRMPPSVLTPSGPVADIGALWSGHALYEASRIAAPTLIVRGEWDSLCTDADAARLMASLTVEDKADVRVDRATHLMHLESQRGMLYEEVRRFLQRVL
jgi:alpha-beta hydrolase superfamily lysophospholipase